MGASRHQGSPDWALGRHEPDARCWAWNVARNGRCSRSRSSAAIDLTSNPPETSTAGPFDQSDSETNLFAYDLSAGTTSLVSATTGGQLSDSSSINAFLSPDGKTVYFDSDASNITTGDSNPNQSTEILKGHEEAVHGLAYSPDGTILATGSHDGAIKLWRAPSSPNPSTSTGP